MTELSPEEQRAYVDGRWMGPGRWPNWPMCPCGLSECRGLKLIHATGHIKGCICTRCKGRDANNEGHRGQDSTHQALGGKGKARHHEESQKPYVVEVTVMPESKSGSQVPANLKAALNSEWLRHAFSQAERGAPVGSHVLPAVAISSEYLIVDLRRVRRLTVRPHSTGRRPLPQ